MRTKNTIMNVATAWLGQMLLIAVNLISRRYFLQILGAEYLGLNSLFANVLSLLSMAEMGVGSAINYSLYKPIANNDTIQICALMQLYKKVYAAIGIFILGVGSLLTPWAPSLVGKTDIPMLGYVYILFVINTGVSYFYSYKASFLMACQKKYLFNINHYLWQLIMYIFQIYLLFLTGNYFVYLICQVLITLFENVTIAKITNKQFPFLKNKKKYKVSAEIITEIKRNTLATILSKIGSTLVTSTDNILVSKFIGIATVGIYGNYSVIRTALSNIIYQAMHATTASIGNLSVVGDSKRKFEIFNVLMLIAVWMYGWGAIGIGFLLSPFISLLYGAQYVLDDKVVFLLAVLFYIEGCRQAFLVYIDAMGLYWHLKYKGIIEALINLVVSIILVIHLGLIGIFLGTLVSNICWSVWREMYVVFNYGLKIPWKICIKKYVFYTMIISISAVIVYFFSFKIYSNTLLGFSLKVLLCIFIPNILFFLIFRNTQAFHDVSQLIRNLIKNKK